MKTVEQLWTEIKPVLEDIGGENAGGHGEYHLYKGNIDLLPKVKNTLEDFFKDNRTQAINLDNGRDQINFNLGRTDMRIDVWDNQDGTMLIEILTWPDDWLSLISQEEPIPVEFRQLFELLHEIRIVGCFEKALFTPEGNFDEENISPSSVTIF